MSTRKQASSSKPKTEPLRTGTVKSNGVMPKINQPLKALPLKPNSSSSPDLTTKTAAFKPTGMRSKFSGSNPNLNSRPTTSTSKSSTTKNKPWSTSKSNSATSLRGRSPGHAPVRMKLDMNATVTNKNSTMNMSILSSINLNSTCAGGSFALGPPPDLTEKKLKCAYNNYLQAMVKQQLLRKMLAKNNNKCEKQLEAQRQMSYKLAKQIDSLQQSINENDIKEKLINELDVLTKRAAKSQQALNPQIVLLINQIKCKLELASDKLYLKNVNIPNSQGKFDEVSKLLIDCKKLLKWFITVLGDVDRVKPLSTCIQNVQQAMDIINDRKKLVDALSVNVIFTTLEKASNALATID